MLRLAVFGHQPNPMKPVKVKDIAVAEKDIAVAKKDIAIPIGAIESVCFRVKSIKKEDLAFFLPSADNEKLYPRST
ncbi:hypothetical protein M0802_011336 [Mischocyttarus mexicanus]|nr:hypothetical protein M0802_011336 [Mischocyttarus mexicanus]